MSSFPGGVDGLGVIGSMVRGESVAQDSINSIQPYCEHPVYVLWDSSNAHLRAILIGQIVEKPTVGHSERMALRTGATSGVGFRHLARKNSKVAGLFGSGEQAIHKVLALQNERKIERYKVFDRHGKSQASCALFSDLLTLRWFNGLNPMRSWKGSDVVTVNDQRPGSSTAIRRAVSASSGVVELNRTRRRRLVEEGPARKR